MRSRFFVSLTFFLVIGSIMSSTMVKAQRAHDERTLLVTKKRIVESAERCYNEDACTGTLVTLQELMNKGYLKAEINPLTKAYYHQNSYVKVENNEYYFVDIEA